MARSFQSLADAQRRATEALELLTSELRSMGRGRPESEGDKRTAGGGSAIEAIQAQLRQLSSGAGEARAQSVDAGFATRSLGVQLRGSAQSTRELGASLSANTQAVRGNTSALASGLKGLLSGFTGGTAKGGGFLSILKGGFGLAPLGSTVAGLFRKKDKPAPVFERFEPPPSIRITATNSAVKREPSAEKESSLIGRRETPQFVATPQIVVNVNAMDSRSFMDRSGDIARALRDAMLHMHPVNDVIGEL